MEQKSGLGESGKRVEVDFICFAFCSFLCSSCCSVALHDSFRDARPSHKHPFVVPHVERGNAMVSLLCCELEKFVKRDWETSDTYSRRVIDRIGNGCGSTNNANFANALRAHRVDIRIIFVNP